MIQIKKPHKCEAFSYNIKSSSIEVGDEPAQYKRKFPHLKVVVEKNRVYAQLLVLPANEVNKWAPIETEKGVLEQYSIKFKDYLSNGYEWKKINIKELISNNYC